MQRVHGDRGTPMPSAVGLTDLILVVDLEDSFRDDIWITFSDIARVEGYRGAQGAADYIKERAEEITIMMMDLDLGDGSCFEVLDSLKKDGKAGAIPTIVTYVDKSQYEVVKRGLGSYPQVKFCIQKEDFIKKMIELSIKIVKKEG
jgi:DNA-binding NtrC family response regulator